MMLLNQVIQMMMMVNLRHVKITCYILYPSFGNFSLPLFHQQVMNSERFFDLENAISLLGMLGGWLCFCVSISIIGALTAVIGDLATHVNN